MRWFRDLSIRKKLFLAIVVILAANFLLLVLLGSTLFQTLYEQSKLRELRKTADLLRASYQQDTQQSWEALFDQIFTVENRNSEVSIFRLRQEEGQPPMEMLYHSRLRGATAAMRIVRLPEGGIKIETDKDASGKAPAEAEAAASAPAFRITPPPFYPLLTSRQLEQLPTLTGDQVITSAGYREQDGRAPSKISLLTRLDENLYLMMDSPREYLASTADLAVKYSAGLSIVVLLAGALVIYYLSGRFTRPIREMEQAAQQIARLDFSASCPANSQDEIGALGASINHMANQLQTSMDALMEKSRLLERDLERQLETDRMRRQFISDVSHDFKTPLALMVSYAEAIRDQKDPARVAAFCDIITGEGNRLSQLVGRLLRLSRLESGMETLEETVFSISEALEEVARAFRLPAEQKELTLAIRCHSSLVVRGDYQKLLLVLHNLVENAIKYTPPGGDIRLVAEAREGCCAIGVENTGSSLEEGSMEQLFTSFYRGRRAREREHRQEQSYGLGLAIVQSILTLHGSVCTAQNTPGGVCFSFALPLVEMEEE